MNKQFVEPTEGQVVLTDLFLRHEGVDREQGGVLKLRHDAFERVTSRGLPNRRVEDWKYTDLRKALIAPFAAADAPTQSSVVAAHDVLSVGSEVDATYISIVNGYFDHVHSDTHRLPPGVDIVPLSKAMSDGHPLLSELLCVDSTKDDVVASLNTAFMTDGVVIRVAAGVKVEAPIHLGFRYFGKESFSSTSRVMISVEEGADVLFFETHDGPPAAPYQSNTMIEIRVSDKAKVSHVRIANDRGAAVALSLMSAVVGAEAKLHTFGVSAGAQVARHQIHVDFKGKNSTALISGVAMPHGQQHSDTTLLVDHIATDCESRELFKTIVGGRATGVFQGRITVEPESQKTDARMMSASLLLSEDATMNNKPELLIFADDVVCAHGATCGQLDEELLFYLMARGLPRQAAELIMLRAFLGEAVETIEDEPLRSVANEFIESWLKVDQATRRANHVEGEYNA